jgi:hypothetical protein
VFRFWPTIYLWRKVVCFVSVFKNFCTASPNIMEPSPCTHPLWELSKDTKNTIWSMPVWWIS